MHRDCSDSPKKICILQTHIEFYIYHLKENDIFPWKHFFSYLNLTYSHEIIRHPLDKYKIFHIKLIDLNISYH